MFSTLALLAALAASQPIYGVAVAGDGDSLTIRGERIRLSGIDAPEFDQTCTRGGAQWACGQEAADQLGKLVTGREVRCVPTGQDTFGRTVARCTAGTVDVNRVMVSLGLAVAFENTQPIMYLLRIPREAISGECGLALSRCHQRFVVLGRLRGRTFDFATPTILPTRRPTIIFHQ